MSKTQLLNLDEFVPATKVVTLKGVSHEMREITVEEYLKKVKEAETQKAGLADETVTEKDAVERSIEIIADAFPTIPREQLTELGLQKLLILVEFTLKAPEQIEAEAKAAQGNG